MIIDFTDEEREALQALEDSYEKLLKDLEKKIHKLRPKDPEAPIDKIWAIEIKVKRPEMPEPIEIKDGTPVYRKADLDAYKASPEYLAYIAEENRVREEQDRLYKEWYNGGSKEWREAYEKYFKLEEEKKQAINDFFIQTEEKHFRALGDDPEVILEDACKQAEQLIINRYNYYDHMRAGGSFSARDVRLQEDGLFRLDRNETKANIVGAIGRHIKALPEELKEDLNSYIERALSSSPFVSDTGSLGAMVEMIERQETTEKGLTVNRPKKYKYPNTKVNRRLFENELTTEDRNFFTPLDLKGNKKVLTYANFVMPSTAISAPVLDDYDERVYAAIGSCLFAGNQFIPFSTLYNRGMLGLSPKEKNREVSDEIKKDILESLEKFLGQVTIDNDPDGELSRRDPDFKRHIIKESLLFYQIREERVHGQVTEGIAIPSGYIPVLYRYAELNREEIITESIEHIYISGVRYTRDNMKLANATFKRVKEIQYKNDKKRYDREIPENERTIRYDTMAEKAGLDFSTMSATERSRFKSRLDKYMKSYQSNGLFARYEHKKDATKSFYAVVIYFEAEPKKISKK